MSFDVLVLGGWVVDGTGAPAYRADVGVEDGRIAAVGRLGPAVPAGRVIDATGRYVMPGFVDCHVHGDALVLDSGVQLAALRQGVTTFVLGQDGLSFGPATRAATFEYATRYFGAVNGVHPSVDGPVTVAELLAGYAGTAALNTAFLVPHGTVRYDVMGPAERTPSEDELKAMIGLIERGLSDGAAGLSSGLEYSPGRYADAAELAALCAPLGSRPYVTHMRGYGDQAAQGLAEAVEIARRSAAALHVSHFYGPAATLSGLVDDARRTEVDLTFDSYPYLRSSTILAMVALPPWIPAADFDLALSLLDSERSRLAREWWPALAEPWPRITVAYAPGFEWAEGLTLTEAAARAGEEPAEFCRLLLIGTGLRAGVVTARPDEGPEGDQTVRALLRHPAQTGGSDGIYVGGHPHPRGFGAFARFLGRHVRELGDWTWEQAAVHLASHPARRFGLTDRGIVRAGLVADLAVVDPATVADTATYEVPRSLATGVDDVLVAGVPVLTGGGLTGSLPGRALRPVA